MRPLLLLFLLLLATATAATASRLAAQQRTFRACLGRPPDPTPRVLVWRPPEDVGLGNQLCGFASAYLYALVSGRALEVAASPTTTAMCTYNECGFPFAAADRATAGAPTLRTDEALTARTALNSTSPVVVASYHYFSDSAWFVPDRAAVACAAAATGCPAGTWRDRLWFKDEWCVYVAALRALLLRPVPSAFGAADGAAAVARRVLDPTAPPFAASVHLRLQAPWVEGGEGDAGRFEALERWLAEPGRAVWRCLAAGVPAASSSSAPAVVFLASDDERVLPTAAALLRERSGSEVVSIAGARSRNATAELWLELWGMARSQLVLQARYRVPDGDGDGGGGPPAVLHQWMSTFSLAAALLGNASLATFLEPTAERDDGGAAASACGFNRFGAAAVDRLPAATTTPPDPAAPTPVPSPPPFPHPSPAPSAAPSPMPSPRPLDPRTTDRAGRTCRYLFRAHHVEPGLSFGSMPLARQNEWMSLGCDAVVSRLKPASALDTQQQQRPVMAAAAAAHRVRCGDLSQAVRARCDYLARARHAQTGVTYGTMTAAERAFWATENCDCQVGFGNNRTLATEAAHSPAPTRAPSPEPRAPLPMPPPPPRPTRWPTAAPVAPPPAPPGLVLQGGSAASTASPFTGSVMKVGGTTLLLVLLCLWSCRGGAPRVAGGTGRGLSGRRFR